MSNRSDIIHFTERAFGGLGKVTVFHSFLELKNVFITFLLIDGSFFYDAKLNSLFSNPELSKSLLGSAVCILPCDCPKTVYDFIENHFRFVISFPMDVDLFRLNCVRVLSQIRSSEPEKISILDDFRSVPDSFSGFFCGESRQIKTVRRQILSAACSKAPVLILGETGTGKTTAANVIHALSDRHNKEIVPISLSTVVESLAESTFFGHVKGSFTSAEAEVKGCFEAADKSTLFMDELGVAPISIQLMLLSVIDTGNFTKVGDDKVHHVDVRHIFATNADIYRMMNEGTFRDDLYHRINDFVIKIPPLRSHKEDIRKMVLNYFDNKSVIISEDAMECLENYNWPGNIRELHKCLNRALQNASYNSMGGVITPEFIDFGDISFPQ